MITTGGIIAALYLVLTLVSQAMGIASGQIQVRLSEALCVLPAFTPAAVPGLFIGCLLANIITGAALPDVIFGSLATLAGAVLTRLICVKHSANKSAGSSANKSVRSSANKSGRNSDAVLAVLPTIICNSLIIPFVLRYAYGAGPLLLNFATIIAGEIISAGILGIIFYKGLSHFNGSGLF